MAFISSSGPLGKYVTTPPALTIWYRSIIGFVFLLLFVFVSKKKLRLKHKSDVGFIIISSVLMAGHWVFYFYALQFSNVAIGMLSLFSYPVITTFLEPLILRNKLDKIHVVLGIILLIGVALLIPEFKVSNNITLGVLFGISSAVCYSLRNIILKWKGTAYDGMVMMTFQAFLVAMLLLPAVFYYDQSVVADNWEALLALGLLVTAVGHSLFVSSFKYFSISKVSIISSLQPLIGIMLAFIFLHEIPSGRTLIGGAIILSVVLLESLRLEKQH